MEPVVFTSSSSNDGTSARGVGNLAVGAEVKIPTARSSLAGTGKTDFTPYLIASHRFGDYDVHANVGYSFVGKPDA